MFFVFKSLISSLISFGVIGFKGSTDRSGDSRNSCISSSVKCTCGWNMSIRCFVNTVVLCLSFFLGLVSPSVKVETLV